MVMATSKGPQFVRLPAEWEIVGGDPAPGDPVAFEELAGYFAETATNAQDAGCRLRRLVEGADDTIWRGQAADAFREDVGKLPERLDKLHNSYHSASEALRIYGVTLRQLQTRASQWLEKAIAADQEQAAYIESLVSASTPGTFPSSMPTGPGPTPAGPDPAAPDPTESARARLAAARNEIEIIRNERETAEANALAKIDHAHDIGIHNQSGFRKFVSGAVNAVGGWVHKGLRVIGDLADRLSDILTVVAVALAVVAAVALILGSGGALAALAGPAAVWLFQAAAVSTAVSAGSKLTSKALFNDADLTWGGVLKGGAMAAVGVFGVGGLTKGAGKLAKVAKRLVPMSKGAAKAGNGVAAIGKEATGVRKLVVNIKEFSKTTVEKAKPLIDRSKEFKKKTDALKTEYLGTDDKPTHLGFLKKAGTNGKKLWKEYGEDPLRIVRPVETGDPASPVVVKVPIGKAA